MNSNTVMSGQDLLISKVIKLGTLFKLNHFKDGINLNPFPLISLCYLLTLLTRKKCIHLWSAATHATKFKDLVDLLKIGI